MTRRVRGKGGVSQRADGRWVAAIQCNGKRYSSYHHDENAAYDALERMQRDLAAGLDPTKQTVGEYLQRWLSQSIEGHKKPNTVKVYRWAVNHLLVPRLGGRRLMRLTAQDVQAAWASMAGSGCTPQEIHYARVVLVAALNRATKWGLVMRNVAALTDVPPVPTPTKQAFTEDQAKRFVAACRGHRLEACYLLGVATGLRISEALGLTWGDVALDGRTITIRRQLQREAGQWVLPDVKTTSGVRTLDLPLMVADALRKEKVEQAKRQLRAGPAWDPALPDLVFTTDEGKPLWRHAVLWRLYTILKKAGLPKLCYHELRHTAASIWLAAGVPLKTVSASLGHSSIRVTADRYIKVLPSQRRLAADLMDGVLRGSVVKSVAENDTTSQNSG